MSAGDRWAASSEGCGPLTPALENALVTSDAVYFTTSANHDVDLVDMALSELLGFSLETEAIAAEVSAGMADRVDPDAEEPEGWDAGEDGPWEPPVIQGAEVFDLMVKIVTGGGSNASGLADAYSVSSSPQLIRYRAKSAKSAETAHHVCDDFSRQKTESPPALFAMVHASEEGPTLAFPAVGVTVEPKAGRVVLAETVMAGGSCDPALALMATSPKADAIVLQKLYYADRKHSREKTNKEGPTRTAPQVHCTTELGCRRFEHTPAAKGEVVMPLRQFSAMSCLPPRTSGPCIDPNYTPPPPKPKPSPPPPPPPEPRARPPGAPPPIP